MATTRNMLSTTFSLFSVSILLFLSPPSTAAQSPPPVALFVLGDSLYDNGMTLYTGVAGGGAANWPYGETFFKRPAGRYSDGRLIPDLVAQYANLPFPKPYLLPGLKDYTKGVAMLIGKRWGF